MKYRHILAAFAAEPWAMQPEKLEALTRFLVFKAEGGEYTAEEVAARIGTKREQAPEPTGGAVAIVPVYGVLSHRMSMMAEMSGGTSYSALSASLRSAVANPDVSAIVLDIDSPGGSVPGTQELAAEIRSFRGEKPIVAQVNHLAASAAYWIAASADEIVVSPSGRAGSIGVYTSHDNVAELLKREGVERTYISAGEHKVEGNEAAPLTKESRAVIQERVDYSYDRFVDGVAEGRAVTSDKVKDDFGKGRVFFASELISRGMADSVATMTETLERFGASDRSEAVRKIVAKNAGQQAAADNFIAKLKAGDEMTIREFENGLKGSLRLSNSEAERAARIYFKNDRGDPDAQADTSTIVANALAKLRGELGTFPRT